MNVTYRLKRMFAAAALATLMMIPAVTPAAEENAGAAAAPPYGYGMGPGMMWGGGYGMGPGMMRSNGYGMGAGMGMGMTGGCGMGAGMMGYGGYYGLNLADTQRTQINKILDAQRREHWATMGRVMDEQSKLRDLYQAERPDPKAVGARYDAISALHRQMVEADVRARNKIDELLTKEQRQQLRGGWGQGSGYGPGMMWPGHRHNMMPGAMMGQ